MYKNDFITKKYILLIKNLLFLFNSVDVHAYNSTST